MDNEKDLISRARALIRTAPAGSAMKTAPDASAALAKARTVLERPAGKLDLYICFDTTGSMGSYIGVVRNNIGQVTDALLSSGTRISINGIGDHCDGGDWIQMYQLSSNAEEARGALESIVMTSGGDTPEAYECLAVELTKRIPLESAGRKKAVVLVADSLPHGMDDDPCPKNVDYQRAFDALKTVSDGFYLVGCNPQTYARQRELIDRTRPDYEQFIPLGKMLEVLPDLLVALAKKTESAAALGEYMRLLGAQDPGKAQRIAGLLGAGK